MSNLRFVFVIPLGAGHYERLEETFRSLAVQKADLAIALCHTGVREDVEHIIAPFRRLIAYERHGPDAGQSSAINEGWRAVAGDIYGWLNADDVLAPSALTEVLRVFEEQPAAAAVCGQSIIVDRAGSLTGLHPSVKSPDGDLYRSNIISQPSCFVRRQWLEQVGHLEEDLHYAMDWDLWVRLSIVGAQFAYTPRVLSGVYWDVDTKTGAFNFRRVSELKRVVARQKDPIVTAKTLFGFAVHHISEYTPLGGLLKALRVGLRTGRPMRLRFWGGVAGGGCECFDVFHYDTQPRDGLVVRFLTDGKRTVRINGVSHEVVGRQHMFDVNVAPGVPVTIEFAGGSALNSELDRIDWKCPDDSSFESEPA
ncbi:glycosyltransferase [Parvularcula sp. LCG005]|uniref:glycosyltransferase n=1 Tax=Parvularcula sp. LCG005 TaxID=3078805 RepID=UPI00294365E1|nr:glycosyltransferase [Parvularcula sp. LCG005]WOI53616.1 glycosyltransferase [Parvularcula sp. LCG005]